MFYKELFLTLFLSFIFGKSEAYDCLGYPWYDATNIGPHSMGCIRFYGTQRMTWIEAEYFCRSENAHLVEIYDDWQQKFIHDRAYEILSEFSMGRGGGPGGAGGPGPPLELGIYRVKFLKIRKIPFFLLFGPP